MGTALSGRNIHVLKLNVVMVGELWRLTPKITELSLFFFSCAGGLTDLVKKKVQPPDQEIKTPGPSVKSAKSYPLASQGNSLN